MILGIIFVAVFNEFGNVNFQLVVIQPWKYTYLHGFTRDIVFCAFIDFLLLESRNADSETTGGPALLSINILEQRPPGASRASRGCSRPSCTRTPGYSSGWYHLVAPFRLRNPIWSTFSRPETASVNYIHVKSHPRRLFGVPDPQKGRKSTPEKASPKTIE